MYRADGRWVVSATDLVGYLECEHLNGLSMAHALGELERPPSDSADDDALDVVRRRGYEHEQRYLDSLRAEDRSIVEIPESRGVDEVRLAADADPRRHRRRCRRHLPGDVLRRVRAAVVARPRRLPGARPRRQERQRIVRLRTGRHQARPQREAGRGPAALPVRIAAHRDPAVRATTAAHRARRRRASVVPLRIGRGVLPPCPPAVRDGDPRRPRRGDLSRAGGALLGLRVGVAVRPAPPRRRPPLVHPQPRARPRPQVRRRRHPDRGRARPHHDHVGAAHRRPGRRTLPPPGPTPGRRP